jgi:serine/threonine protein kinase
MVPHEENTVHLTKSDLQKSWGDFKFIRRLGRGGSGEVYLVHDPTLDREVALKLGRPDRTKIEERLESAVEEARILASLRHPNIVTIFGAACHDSRIGFWMDYIEGSDYNEIVKKQGPLSAEETIRVGMDVCKALAQVHGLGLLHRDIKAHNVVREKGGRTVLMDFGTMAVQKKSEEKGLENISGTPHFMPPELFDGTKATPAYDIYSLGVLLFFLLSGEFPIPGESLTEVISSIGRGERKRLRDFRNDLDIELIDLVEKAFANDVAERFQSAAEMESALHGLLKTSGASSPGPTVVAGPEVNRERRNWVPWSIGIAFLAVILTLAIQYWPMGSGSLEVTSTFLKKSSVGSSYMSIRDGDSLNLGDVLRIELHSLEEIFVYVINQDDRGNTFLLFPSSQWQISNPLRADTVNLLPGETLSGRMAAGWEVNSVGVYENFLLVASRYRLDEFENQLAEIPEAGNSTPGSLAQTLGPTQMVGLSRGVGGVSFVEDSESPSGTNLLTLARLVSIQAEATSHNDDVWVGWVSFRNSN